MTKSARRLSQLLGMPVLNLAGEEIGHVNDVRLVGTSASDKPAVLRAQGVVVADRFVGSLLGYDRRAEHGPWAVRSVVRWIHRGARLAPWDAVQRVDWAKGTLTVDETRLTPLSDSSN